MNDQQPASRSATLEQPVFELLKRMLDLGGRMPKGQVRQLAREVGLGKDALDRLLGREPRLLDSEDDDHVVTDIGRQRVHNMR